MTASSFTQGGPRRRSVDVVDAGAAFVARAAGVLARFTRLGAGTSVPGRLVQAVDAGFLSRRAQRLAFGSVVVSGTNGKTTTASMLQSILRAEGRTLVANRSGANLRGGVVSAFVTEPASADAGVFEVDEAALPSLVGEIRPRVLVLTNVFRDQLDRFPEPERVAALLRRGAEALPDGSTVVANADDPLLWASLEDLRPVGFSLVPQDRSASGDAPGFDSEPETCVRCGTTLRFEWRTIANLGSARCGGCGWCSTAGSYSAKVVSQAGLEASVLEFDGELLTLPLGGIHNAYNAVAALAAAGELGVPTTRAVSALEEFHARFGRAEELLFEDRHLWMALAKNPAGAGVVIQEVCADPRVGAVVVAISDRDADGRDVSWIWDADLERVASLHVPLIATGTRAADTAVRFKYAGRAPDAVDADPSAAVRAAADRCGPDGIVAVLATYTAMLDIREALLGDRSSRVDDDAA
jgi:UDP-N-acetylmuramyl tripeptide synthase